MDSPKSFKSTKKASSVASNQGAASPTTKSSTPQVSFAPNTDQGNRRQALANRRASLRLDVASFAAEFYRPEVYLKSTMEADTEEAVHGALRSLTAACDKSVAELRRAVYKNHAEFLKVGKGIMEFEGGLGELRGIQSALKSAANALVTSAGVADFTSIDETQGNTEEEREQVKEPQVVPTKSTPKVDVEGRKQKMISLSETINDFDKYLVPERYLVFEGSGMNETSSSSTTPKPITLYLFNDSIAMASAKKGPRLPLPGGSSSKKLSIERLWLLNEVAITEIPDSKHVTNAIKIVRGGEEVILMTENIAGKKLWLQQLKKTQQALISSPALSPTTSFAPVQRPKSPAAKDPSAAHSHRRRPSNISSATKKHPVDSVPDIASEKFSTMFGLLDELNEDTDKCSYDRAVENVDKIKYELAQMDPRSSSLHVLNQRLQHQVTKLANFLYHEISDLIIGKEAMSKHIQRLVVLGFPDEAREKFLAARSDFIKERTKHLRYVGDIAKTVNDIGFATFSSISASADWFVSSFKDHTMTAGFVFWIKLEINNYVNMISKQVFQNGDIDFRLIGDCISIARRQCSTVFLVWFTLHFSCGLSG